MMIQKLRIQHGWSQEHLAELTGVSVRTIQRLEQGKPGLTQTLKSLGVVFNVPFLDLKFDDTKMTETYVLERETRHDIRRWRGFYIHLAQYVAVMFCLAAFNYYTYSQSNVIWVVWSGLGWGVAVVLHYLGISKSFTFFGMAWCKRQVDRMLMK